MVVGPTERVGGQIYVYVAVPFWLLALGARRILFYRSTFWIWRGCVGGRVCECMTLPPTNTDEISHTLTHMRGLVSDIPKTVTSGKRE